MAAGTFVLKRFFALFGSGEGARSARGHEGPRDAAWPEVPPTGLVAALDAHGVVLDLRRGALAAADPLTGLDLQGRLASRLASVSPLLAEGLVRGLEEQEPFRTRSLFRLPAGSVLIEASFLPGSRGAPSFLTLAPDPAGSLALEDYANWADAREQLADKVLSALAVESEPTRLGQAVLPLLVEGLDMEAAALFVVSGERSAELAAAFGRTRQRGFPYDPLELEDPVVSSLLRRPRITSLDPSSNPQPALLAVLCRDFRRALLVPAVAGHGVVGFLVLSRRMAEPPYMRDLNVLRLVARYLGLALRNRALSTESNRSAAVLETAYAVSRAISRSLDVEQTFKEIAMNAARIVGGSHCLLLELEKDSGELVAVASSDQDDSTLTSLRVCFPDSGDLAEMERRRSLVIEDLVWGARVSNELRSKLQMKTALFLPMFAHGALVGSLLLYTTARRHEFSHHEVARAEDIAEQAAIAIQNACLYRDLAHSQSRVEALLGRLARIREHERQSFASLVHDDIVQSIVGAVYELQAAREGVQPSDQGDFDRVTEILRTTIKDARRIIWELRPPVLDELGLAESLRALAERMNGEGPAQVKVLMGQVPDLSRSASTAVYKIAREALLNARRHADAVNVTLRLWREDSMFNLEVTDDGQGFDGLQVKVGDHYGLAMLEEQAALVGGSALVESSPGLGTTIRASIPVEE